jgi:CRISPR-associated protein Cas2
MAENKLLYLVCYDISDQKRWRRAYKLLKGYGRRVQFSIFRCRINKRQLERLRWELEKILETEDRLLIASLCSCCSTKVISRNAVSDWDEDQPKFAVI